MNKSYMNMVYRPPEEGEVFNTFHDMVHAAILCARSGTATLKEIYAACTRFGRVRCRRTGGWRLVTERRNWKSHVRHTLYTTEKFLRCPHDSDSWMIAPEFCYAIPQTTRQLMGNVAQEEGAEATARGSLARNRTKAAQRTQYATLSANQEEVRGHRQLTRRITPARQHAVAGPATGAGSSDGGDTDRYGYTDRDGGDWSGGELQDDEQEEEAEQRLQCTMPSLREDRAACASIPVGALATNAKAYGVGSLAGRTQALLGVTAAAAAALRDEELDLNDAGTRTALRAAQEVLNNPAAAKILLRLMQQRQVQEQKQLQELLQQQNQHARVAGLQDSGAACRAHRKRRLEDSFEGDGEGGLAPVVEDHGQDEGISGWRSASQRLKRDRQVENSNGRQPLASEAMPHSRSTAHRQLSARTQRTQSGSKGGRCSGGACVAGLELRFGSAGRPDAFDDGGGRGADRRWAMPRTSQYVDAAWPDDEDTEGDGWDEHPDVDDEEWDADEDAIQCRHHGGVPLRPSRLENSRGRRDKVPIVASVAAEAVLGRHEGSPPRQALRLLTPVEQLSYIQSTAHLNVATTAAAAAAAAAAVAVATAAGDAPMRCAGPSDTATGTQRGWSGRTGSGVRADSAGDTETEESRHKRVRDSSYLSAPMALQNLAGELQVYQSRSTAAAAAAAAVAMASSANMQQARGYPGHIVC
ncbi:hypothetical protein VaNZ11_004780 [Volvox africanus]|uniref:Fork-head domain-containing protein n=1 Tax=Volvox africanus TaxID=51714 RepID=A0ABQ5RYG7_9CHLO|nr:hypothetical protein VaNZ11_004780 [Volvox africanus]